MRIVGRLLLDRFDLDETTIQSGAFQFAVRRAESTPEGVRQIVVDLPAVDFLPRPPVVSDGAMHVGEQMLVLHPNRRFTALAVPNSHLVSIDDRYDERELTEVAKRVAGNPETFPIGANLSFVLPLGGNEIFVRTYERGAGLTMSCGSGVAASRVVCSRLGLFDYADAVTIRNPGGISRSWLREVRGQWLPSLEGNASLVYRCNFDTALLAASDPFIFDLEPHVDEIAAFGALNERNRKALRAAGVDIDG
jgi:diaminopimelate epimerase